MWRLIKSQPDFMYEWKRPLDRGVYQVNFESVDGFKNDATLLITNSSTSSCKTYNPLPEEFHTSFSVPGNLTLTLRSASNNFSLPAVKVYSVLQTTSATLNGMETESVILLYSPMKDLLQQESKEKTKPAFASPSPSGDSLEKRYIVFHTIYQLTSKIERLLFTLKEMVDEKLISNPSEKERLSLLLRQCKENYLNLRTIVIQSDRIFLPEDTIINALLDPRIDSLMNMVFDMTLNDIDRKTMSVSIQMLHLLWNLCGKNEIHL